MIDTHLHVVPPNLPGVGALHPLLLRPPDEVAAALRGEMLAVGATHALAMGHYPTSADDPLGIQSTLRIAKQVPGLRAIGIAAPDRADAEHLARVEAVLAEGRVSALKAYLGYIHHYPSDPGYLPYYQLAAKYRIPVVFHTGDTYSAYAKLKFAHPLGVDEVAVDFPNTHFVLAHVGNPWLIDAAEVAYKNLNVSLDVSGLLLRDGLGDPDSACYADAVQRLRHAFEYTERPNRFLFGTDWPLAPIGAYADFIAAAIPEEYHDMVFRENPQRLYRLGT